MAAAFSKDRTGDLYSESNRELIHRGIPKELVIASDEALAAVMMSVGREEGRTVVDAFAMAAEAIEADSCSG